MVARLREVLGERSALIGVIGAVLLLVGGSWYQALVTPPYRFIDEQAHVGYVVEIQHGQLPTIDTTIDEQAAGRAMVLRLDRSPARAQDVWVANNPPLTYILAAGPGAITNALDIPGGPLLGLRLINIAAVAGAVALTYLLGRDLAGGDPTVGLVAAGIMAASPHLGFVAALGFNDGVAILAATGVLLWLARVCGAGPDGLDPKTAVRWLGAWCAVAALSRPMALIPALVAGALAFAFVVWRRRTPVWWSLGWLALPSALLAGWFYVLNIVRYGDPTGSSALFDKFYREPAGTLWGSLTLLRLWEGSLRTIFTRRMEQTLPSDPLWVYWVALVVTLAGIIGAVVLVTWSKALARRGEPVADQRLPSPVPLPAVAWAATAVVTVVPVLLTAQHRAGGGGVHPRYLLPMLPLVATAIALTAVRVATRWTGIALIAGLATVTAVQIHRSAQWLGANLVGSLTDQLTKATAGPAIRTAGLGVAALGFALLIVAIAAAPAAARSRRPAE